MVFTQQDLHSFSYTYLQVLALSGNFSLDEGRSLIIPDKAIGRVPRLVVIPVRGTEQFTWEGRHDVIMRQLQITFTLTTPCKYDANIMHMMSHNATAKSRDTFGEWNNYIDNNVTINIVFIAIDRLSCFSAYKHVSFNGNNLINVRL